ncbi:SdrD B-like domain-containing protein [Siccirubricoccus phaeus]|uniref:SdrD B-like domain-containing protein n=1 Tax=Siccirubricoccus phaeus TaxID=2595053 RepID=UPI0011F3AE4A|nr:SdrD B-like domain-containing protein [Siccirubricoccus phaeus]
MPLDRAFANITDDGLLFSNIHATEESVGAVNSVLGDASMVATGASNPPVGAPVAGLRWAGFVGGTTGPGQTLTLTLEYDVTSTTADLITAIRTNSFTPDSAIPVGSTLSLVEEIYSADGTLVGRSSLTRAQSVTDTADPPFEAGDVQFSMGYASLHVKVTVVISTGETAAGGSTFSLMNQNYATASSAGLASLGDVVFEDADADGIQDAGETGIAGVTVQLLNNAGAIIATTTAADGSYHFSNLIPGTFAVHVVSPEGYLASPANQGGDDAADSDAVGGTTQQVTLAAGENNPTLDAGFYKLAGLGDVVFADANADGIQDAGEAGIAGVTVELLDAQGQVAANTATAADGSYSFTGLPPGTYSVRFVTPAGYEASPANQGGNDAKDSDAVEGVTQQVTLTSGEYNSTLDAGFFKPAPVSQPVSLGDVVFEDRDADGIQDAGEKGIGGVTVELLDAAGAVIATTTTAADGSYLFEDKAPGTYSVHFVAPEGYVATAANRGADDAKDSDAVDGTTQQVTLTSGQTDLTLDAGFYKLAALGDKVWFDGNRNGIQDGGEAGFGNVTVQLLDAGGSVIRTTVTDGNGNYGFTGLVPGTYSVKFVAPNGYSLTGANRGGDDGRDSDAASNGATQQVTLSSGEMNNSLDAGLVQKTVYNPCPSLCISKVTNGCDGPTILEGSAVTWTYTVKNTGNVALTNVVVKDNREGLVTEVTGDNGNGILDAGETWTFTETGIAGAGAYCNTATATAKYTDAHGSRTVGDSDSSSYFGAAPKIDVEKYVSVDGGCTWYDADGGTGPLAAEGASVKFKFVVTNTGNVTLNNIVLGDDQLDLNGRSSGTTVKIGSLAADSYDKGCYGGSNDSYTLIVDGTWQAGQHTDTATVSAKYTDGYGNAVTVTVTDSDSANFYGIQGPGVHSACDWGSSGWKDLWDGDRGSSLSGRGDKPFDSDILYETYGAKGVLDPVSKSYKAGILVGDFNKNGVTDAGEKTFFYSQPEALAALNAADNCGDMRLLLGRELVASWLNYLAGNAITDPADSSSIFDARDAMTQAIAWLGKYSKDESHDGFGDGSLTLNASTYKLGSGAAAWTKASGGLAAGRTIEGWLEEYNDHGSVTNDGVTTKARLGRYLVRRVIR